ncbi:hypothetical protein E7X23_25945, partial [Bacteroides fragilis]
YLRPELKFDGIEGLIAQLHQDAADVEALLGKYKCQLTFCIFVCH